MIGELPRVEQLDAEAVRGDWPAALARVAGGETRLLIERDGKPVAALISADDFRSFVQQDERRRADLAALHRLQDAFAEAFAGVPEGEIEAEIAKAITEVRAERSIERGPAGA